MQTKYIITILILNLFAGYASGQNNKPTSFKKLNADNSFISFSFGMGANYSSNPSLIEFIESDIDFYNTVPADERFSSLQGGLEFFSGIEYQISRNYSIKGQYSFFTKTLSLDRFPNYEYSYINHQPYIIFNYIIPDEHSFIKLGIGGGYIITDFTAKKFGAQSKYSSTGFGLMGEALANLQVSRNVGGYLSVYTFKTFAGELKDDNGNNLMNNNVESVNVGSFGAGLRLGMEIFIF